MKHKLINSNIEYVDFLVFALFCILTSFTLFLQIDTIRTENNGIMVAWAEEINGTENSDNITGTINQDTIKGFGGNDTIFLL